MSTSFGFMGLDRTVSMLKRGESFNSACQISIVDQTRLREKFPEKLLCEIIKDDKCPLLYCVKNRRIFETKNETKQKGSKTVSAGEGDGCTLVWTRFKYERGTTTVD